MNNRHKATDALSDQIDAYMRRALAAEAEVERLNGLINAPQVMDFLKAVQVEVAHQRERWGEDHDASKDEDWWIWTAAYLVTKASQASRYGDREKYLHHIITTAALCANWHRHATSEKRSHEKDENHDA